MTMICKQHCNIQYISTPLDLIPLDREAPINLIAVPREEEFACCKVRGICGEPDRVAVDVDVDVDLAPVVQ